MKIKINSTYPKKTIEVDNVFFSSDLHLNHEAVIKFGRDFGSVEEMNSDLIAEINRKVEKNDLLVLLGDTMMGEKNYVEFLLGIKCENVIMLFGNHCNRGKLLKVVTDCQIEKLLHTGDYLELFVDKQFISCSHYPQFNWNNQDEGSFHLHGHLHGDENTIMKEVHKYKTMDVGVDSYYNMFGEYSIFSLLEIKDILKNKLTIGRHE